MVFILKDTISPLLQKILTSFAAGVMTAACFWSLLAPALEESQALGRIGFLPVAAGFIAGVALLLFIDELTPHIHLDQIEEGPKSKLKRTTKLILAVTIHNIPEGMAAGVLLAGCMYGNGSITAASALALSIGLAAQNFPEGAIVSMPLRAEGMQKSKTFWAGVLSGAAEPIAGIITIMASGIVISLLPYLLSFAAGAVMYVIVEELIPEMSKDSHSNHGTIAFTLGFIIMMSLDTTLG